MTGLADQLSQCASRCIVQMDNFPETSVLKEAKRVLESSTFHT